MLYPSEEDWAKWGISDECHRFFVLHWEELFNAETPDTWQVRTCNIVTMLGEIIDVARIARVRESARAVLRSILDETLQVIDLDQILKNYYSFVSSYLNSWRGERKVEQRDLVEIERLATVIRGNLRDYWDRGIELVLHLLHEANKNRKKELYAATMNVAVATVSRGQSLAYLCDLLKTTVLVEAQIGFVERVESMFRGLATTEQHYECVFWTAGVKRQLTDSLPRGIELQEGAAKGLTPGSVMHRFYKGAPPNQIFLKVTATAADPESAWRRADQRLGEIFAGVNLFDIDRRFSYRTAPVLVTDTCGAQSIVGYRPLGTSYLGTYDSRQTKAEMQFRVLGRASQEDRAQLSAASQYHRLALQATSDEARLLNLWIALEALCQGEDGSIIERICRLISPCVSLENVQKNLTSLAQYVRFLWTDKDINEFLELFPSSSHDRLETADMANLLLLPKDHEDINKFYALCARHPLIMHRVFRIRSITFEKPAAIANNLEFTRQNVEWQLKRIYRVRNSIVHTGSADLLLPQLLQHLHCYLIKAIKSILTELDRNPTWGIRDALEHRRLLFEHVVAFFKSGNGHEISVEAILDPHACMRPQRAPFAWREQERAAQTPVSAPIQPPPAPGGSDSEQAARSHSSRNRVACKPKRSASDIRSEGRAGWSKRIAAGPGNGRQWA